MHFNARGVLIQKGIEAQQVWICTTEIIHSGISEWDPKHWDEQKKSKETKRSNRKYRNGWYQSNQIHRLGRTESKQSSRTHRIESIDFNRSDRSDRDPKPNEVLKKQSRNIFGTNNFACIKDNEVNELSQNLTLLSTDAIENLKEIHLLKRGPPNELPPNVFNVIIDDIIQKMCNPDRMNLSDLRNSLYDMLIYNLLRIWKRMIVLH